jgi:F-type H+-transporting ATPase subunit a
MAILIAWEQEKFKWIVGFYIPGIPAYIILALWIIEFLSYCMRLLSLTLRLFINLAAGHLLLKVFVGLLFLFIFYGIMDFCGIQVKTWACFALDMSFMILEILACMLQAVVMSSLIAIYIDHSIRFVH